MELAGLHIQFNTTKSTIPSQQGSCFASVEGNVYKFCIFHKHEVQSTENTDSENPISHKAQNNMQNNSTT